MNSLGFPIAQTSLQAPRLSSEARSIFLVIVISGAIIAPITIFGIPSNLDLTNHFRFALPFYDAIHTGNFYPGWLAESNHGYGDPSFRFYPPAFYYLLALTRMVSGDWYSATVLSVLLLSIAGGLGMYAWAKSLLPKQAAIWASIFYALAPYHVNQLYQASLLAEYAASAVLPFAFFFVERVCTRQRNQDVAGLAAVYALLILTHLPLTIIGSLALLVYALARIKRGNCHVVVARLFLAVVLGLGASAVYWTTMVAELGWIRINAINPDASADYRNNFLLSTLSPDNLNVWWMNIVALMTLLLCAPVLAFFAGGQYKRIKHIAVVILFATFMALPLSRPIWKLIPPLQQTQFPWRWLAVISIAGSILAAGALPIWFARPGRFQRTTKVLVLGGVIISIAFTMSHMVREAQYLSKGNFGDTLNSLRGSASVNYWFPIWATPAARAMQSPIEISNRTAAVEFWEGEHRRFSVSPGSRTEARVKTFYYPHWVATSNGRSLATRPDKDGALLISLPDGGASVDLQFVEPQRTYNFGALSVVAWLLIGGMASPLGRKSKVMSQLVAPAQEFALACPGAETIALRPSESLQQNHYNEIAADYEAHYSDRFSLEYRRRFIYDPMFENINLTEMSVLDAMCGSGQTTEYLLARNARLTGLDISREVLNAFRSKWTNCKAVEKSLIDSGFPENSFDCVVVVGGLHHLHPHVSHAVNEIHRVLKPGGYFCFMEPHSGSLPDLVRRFWYKHDRFFSANEAAIDIGALRREFEGKFKPLTLKYLGNLAFLFVLNSMIFRIPIGTKPFYAPFLLKLEFLLGKIQTRLTSCFAVVQWQKR